MARKIRLSARNLAAYFATAIFSAAFEIAYEACDVMSPASTNLVSAIPVLRVMTFACLDGDAPLSKGRKAFMVCTTPTTLILN